MGVDPGRKDRMMSELTRDRILDDVAGILADFHGREYLGTISLETRFFADLGLASIDAVVLGETLQNYYQRPFPFADLMARMGQRTDRDLTMGELVEFLHAHQDIPAN